MPTLVSLPSADPVQEPVSLAVANVHARLGLELDSQEPAAVAEREYVQLLLTSARQACEGFTGRFFAGGQTVEATFRLDEVYQLPPGAVPTAVRGFFTDLADLEGWDWEEYRKGSIYNRELTLSAAAAKTYTVTATLPQSVTDACPALAKTTILELFGEWYRNRESSSVGTISPELPVNYRVKLASLNLRPALH